MEIAAGESDPKSVDFLTFCDFFEVGPFKNCL